MKVISFLQTKVAVAEIVEVVEAMSLLILAFLSLLL